MILFSRITCYIVIVQLFALSGIPAAEKLGFTGNHANFLSHFESASDQKVIPEHQDGDLNNELTFNLEEERLFRGLIFLSRKAGVQGFGA
jgi:hypothetical protein